MNRMHVHVATIETGTTLDAAGATDSDGPITFVATDRLTALQHAYAQLIGLADLRHYDEEDLGTGEDNPHVLPSLRHHMATNPLPEAHYEDAFELEAWLKAMNSAVSEPWFSIQRLEVLSPHQRMENAAA